MRKLIWTMAVLAVLAVLAPVYWWMAVDNRMPEDAGFDLDIAEVRRLAESLPGARPAEIRYEKVLAFAFPGAMIQAGEPWSPRAMPVYSFQLVYPDHTAIIDTAMAREIAKPDFMVPFYDDAAYARMQTAIGQARWIAITHEHMDHIGGALAHPDLAQRLAALRLTDAQLADPERMKPAEIPAGAFATYTPLHYERTMALAPGVVLIAAPGHTPGSQIIYVRTADDHEFLFLGDVAWHLRNVVEQQERPRWVTTLLIQEDRHAVFGQLRALHELAQREPGIALVPGHDGAVIDALTRSGALLGGFAP